MEAGAPSELILASRKQMIAEAKRIIDAARERGMVLRLIGGLAVRFHCQTLDFCERDYGDVDLVGHAHDAQQIAGLFADLGYEEVIHVRQATTGRQLQFSKERPRKDTQGPTGEHPEDHVDVFLDTFKMDHAIDLSGRLGLDEYTISVSDVLVTKLQIAKLNEKDERDIFTLLQDLELGVSDSPGTINVPYVAQLCARDWGLFHDVELNLSHLGARLEAYPLESGERDEVREKLALLTEAIEAYPKSRAWRVREKIGTRLPWHDTVEEQG